MDLITRKIAFVFFVCLGFCLNFQAFSAKNSTGLSKSELNSLSIKCESDTVFTQNEIQFVLEIPRTELSDVQFDMPELPLGVRFISSMKTSAVDENSGLESSKIQIWLLFFDSGDIKLPPITAKIGGRTVYIPFEKVSVFENPAVLSPILSVDLNSNGSSLKVGSEICIDVYVQFCVQILNFSFNIPKDAILSETYRDEFTKGDVRKPDFSVEKTKIASFVWKPLESGEIAIPEITIDAIAYNGDRKSVSTADLGKTVKINDGVLENNDKNSNSNIFDSAFFETSSSDVDLSSEDKRKLNMSNRELMKLIELRIDERHSFPYSAVMRERKAFEQQFGIEDSENEASLPLALFFSVLSLGFIVWHLIMVLKKKPKMAVFSSLLFILSIVFSIRQNLKVQQKYAISTGGKIYSVPEEKNDGGVIPTGIRLKIVESVGEWFYIECSEMSGWTKSDSVIIIQ